ncbi:MAG: protein kinase [Chthoniobacterales bacterium]
MSGSADSLGETHGTSQVRRFENYEVMLDEAGSPIELGRGAMGVTYKALDVDLRCPVTLKVISERYLGDEAARLRFLREARAAASVRHPNVASVFHLGRTGRSYFYAMEFVEGETLEHLIRRSGPVETKLALEITTQVAAGLAAVHEQNLVHRDIKPSNIMVRLKDDVGVMAKIIDLGLAKAIDEAGAQTAISTPGAFAGTPEFASPEQFAGVPVDIRSDLYSLGITLWQMLTSRPPFRGTPAELIFQHQQAPLPLEQLKGAPQPVIVLLEVLLQKDPARRFQTPAELLELMPAIADVTEARRTIKHRRQWATLLNNLSSRQVKLPTPRVSKRSVAVLPFESLSDDKGDTYFADGVQDEILSSLVKASHLKVISRTSVMTFRPRGDRDLRSIAEALGVAYVLEGTVRRHGDRVRITIRLVGARTDKALWSESYDRDVTDVFVIQSEIAETVAHKLRARLSPAERQGIKEKPTNDLESYDLYLQAKQLIPHGNSMLVLWVAEQENLLKGVRLLEEATQRDPKFALAYCLIAKAHDFLYFDQLDHTQERRALGDAAVNEALRIRPDLPEVHLAAAFHLYRCYRDFERARVQIAIAARTLSSHSELLELAAMIDWRQGRWERSIAGLERAASLDPRNPELLELLAENYFALRRYRDSERIRDRQIALQPDQPLFRIMKADTAFAEKADVKGARAVYEALPSAVKNDIWITMQRAFYAMCDRDWRTAEEIVNSSPNEEIGFSGAVVPRRVANIWLELVQGNHSTTEKFGTTREQLCRKVETDRTNPMLLSVLACVDVALGRKEEAIREARSAVQSRPASEDALDGAYLVFNLAMVYAWAIEPDLAFEQLVILINTPNRLLTYGSLKVDPTWDPLRKDPRFDDLLAQLAITGVIDARRRITRQTVQKTPASASHVGTRKPSARSEPKKISVARLPVTGSDVFGREEDVAFLDRAWANKDINVATIVAWAGVGKSTLVNHWLRRMAADHYRSAELIFGWSFYRQGTSGDTSSADEFLDAALSWFGDPDPRLGTAWEKGERLAKLVAHRRNLLVLDGLEPLQNPPGPQEGRLREPSLQAFLAPACSI